MATRSSTKASASKGSVPTQPSSRTHPPSEPPSDPELASEASRTTEATSPALTFEEVARSPGTDSLEVPRPSPEPPGPTIRSSRKPPRKSQVVGSMSDDEEEEDLRSASERDGDMTDASSAGESIPGENRRIDTTDLVDLCGSDKCRVIYMGTSPGGGPKIRLVCGRTISKCNQHAKKRLASKKGQHGPPRWYVHSKASQGETLHGRCGENSYTHAEYRAMLEEETAEIAQVVQEMEEASSTEDGSHDGNTAADQPLGSLPVVNFGGATTFQTPPRSVLRESSRRLPLSQETRGNTPADFDLPDAVAAQIAQAVQDGIAQNTAATALKTAPRSARNNRSSPSPRNPPPVVTIEDTSEEEEDGEDEDEYAFSDQDRRVSKPKKHGAPSRRDGPEWVGLLTPRGERVIRKEAKDGKTTLSKGWKLKNYFSNKKEARVWLNSKENPSDSEPSSSDSEGTVSDSSSGPDRVSKLAKRTQRKRKKKKDQERASSYRGSDPSTEDSKRIHGLEIDDPEIDKLLAPEDLKRSDRGAFIEAAVDVTALPGMFSTGSQTTYDEVQGVTEAATSMLATMSGKRAQLHDTQWKTMRKNTLGTITKQKQFFSLIETIEDSSEPAFEQQDSKIRLLMYRRKYDADMITDYLEHGLLPTISRQTYAYFMGLLNAIRQLYYTNLVWEGGPAKAMLDFHAKGLGNIRAFSPDYRTFTLKVYAFLQDTAKKGYFHAKMSQPLWDRVAQLELSGEAHPPSKPSTDKADSPRCSHCKNRDLHNLLGLQHSKTLCPVLDLTGTHLRAAIKEALTAFKNNPESNKADLVDEILKLHK
jgi:hypothetical protein